MRYVVTQLGKHQPYFAHVAFLRRFSQVEGERIRNAALRASYFRAKPAERVDARVHIQGCSRVEMGTLLFNDGFDVHG